MGPLSISIIMEEFQHQFIQVVNKPINPQLLHMGSQIFSIIQVIEEHSRTLSKPTFADTSIGNQIRQPL
jgi:hypothetical protein